MFIKKLSTSFFLSTRKPQDIFIMSLLVLGLLWQPSYLHQELNLFEWGLYLPGIDAVTQGLVPFRDFIHLRGPFELYVPAFFMKIFGFRADVLATYFYLGTLLTMLVSVLIVYELVQLRVLLYSFVLILVTRTFPRVVFTFWGGMRYMWGLLAVWCLIRFLKTKRPGWLLAAGCFAAIGIFTSIEIGVIVLFTFLMFVALSRDFRRWSLVFLAGFLIISVPYGCYLLSQNALMPFVQDQWVVVTHLQKIFLQTYPVPNKFHKFLLAIFYPLDKIFYQMTPMYCYMFFFSYYFWRMFKKRNMVMDQAALVVAVYGLMLFLTGLRNFWSAQYEMSLQPEKILLFFMLGQFIIWAQQKFSRFQWAGAILLTAVIISTGIYSIGRFKTRYYKFSWASQLVDGKDRKKQAVINGSLLSPIDLPRIRHMTIPVSQLEDLEQLSQFVNEHVPVQETVWMYPELGSLNFILQRPWVGRFPMATLSWLDDGWFAEYEKTLELSPPRYAIINKKMPYYFETIYFLVPANRIKHERIMRFLHEHYVIEEQTPTYFICRWAH